MQRSLSVIFLGLTLALLAMAGCGGPPPVHKALKRTLFAENTAVPKLFIRTERDRSGGEYFKLLDQYDLTGFTERFTNRLLQKRLRFSGYNEYGEPREVKLVNPFEVVGDSTEADLVLEVYIDGIEAGDVEVTGDRIAFWNGFGITQYVQYQRVPRVLIAISAQLRDPKTKMSAYEVTARGVSVNRMVKREGYDIAMKRCEERFYERLLAR